MESKRSFDKAIDYLNSEIEDYEQSIKECEMTIISEQCMLDLYESAMNDYIRIRDSLDINNWNGFLGEYGWIHINKHFSDDE